MESIDNTQNQDSVNNTIEQELFAGKYKSTEELVKGYGEQQKYIDSLRNSLKDKESLLSEYSPPTEYKLPEGLNEVRALHLKELAKNNNLTQKQLDGIISNIIESDNKVNELQKQKKSSLGSDYDKIKNYVEVAFPTNKHLQEAVINTALLNQEAAKEILNQREYMHRSTIPNGNPVVNKDSIEVLEQEYFDLHPKWRETQDPSIKKKLIDIGDRIYALTKPNG